jgi:hypothetical protein
MTRGRVLALVLAVLALLFPARALAAAPRLYPAGQEELFADLLGRGAKLPGGCAWAGASIGAERVTSRYTCGAAQDPLEIAVLDRAGGSPGAVLTAELAIEITRGPAPPGLVEAIADRARSRESKIAWTTPAELQSAAPPPALRGLGAAAKIPRFAWLALAAWIAAAAVGLALALRKPRGAIAARAPDLGAFAVMTVLALALRLSIPWGPMDFAEPARLVGFWSVAAPTPPGFESLPALMQLLHDGLGIGLLPISRFTGPILGAVGVGCVYWLAREMDLGRSAALLAAAIVLGWPAHARYSASASLTVLGATIWTAALAVALTRALAPAWKVSLLGILIVIGVYTRPEYRLLVLAVAPLCFGPGWTWRSRGALLAILAASLAPYAIAHLVPEGASANTTHEWRSFFFWILHDVSVGPAWWVLLAIAGLVFARPPRAARWSLRIATLVLLVAYTRFGSENNPLFGEWRYALSVVPFAAVAAASLCERVARERLFAGRERARDRAIVALAAASTLAGLLIHRRALMRPLDLQTEHAYVLESGPRIARAYADLVVLAEEGRGAGGLGFETNAAMALALGLGPACYPSPTAARRSPGETRMLWSQAALVEAAPGGPSADRAAIFIGLMRDDAYLAALRARYDLVPIEEQAIVVAPTAQAVSSQCRLGAEAYLGGALGDCSTRLGWYRAVPR